MKGKTKFQKKLGWIPNKLDARDLSFSRLAFGSTDIAPRVLPIGNIKNQEDDPSCVGQACTGALRCQELAQNLNSSELSANFAYYLSRIEDMRFKSLSKIYIPNDGTTIRSCVKAGYRYGFATEKDWPSSHKTINKKPSINTMVKADKFKNCNYYSIVQTEDNLINELTIALSNSLVPIFGAFIPQSFLYNSGPSVIDYTNEPVIGGHAMYIRGFRFHSNHGWIFLIVNSWGIDWREGGQSWVTSNFLKRCCANFTVINSWRQP